MIGGHFQNMVQFIQSPTTRMIRGFNIWILSYQYRIPIVEMGPKWISYLCRDSQCGEKMISWSSYLHKEISFTGEIVSSYWNNHSYES